MVSQGKRQGGVAERIVRMRDLLRKWVEDGIPQSEIATFPRSLRQAKAWDAPGYGILPVGSPNDFVTTHPIWGTDIALIAQYVKKLDGRYPQRPDTTSLIARARGRPVLRSLLEVRELREQQGKLIRQWQEARADADSWKDRAERAETRLGRTKEKLAEARQEISELKNRLAARTHLRLVK